MKSALLGSGMTEKLRENEDCGTGGRPWIIESAGEPESEPISIVRGEPSELSSILVSPSEAPFQRRFVLCLVPLESQAGRDLVPRFDRVAELPCQIDHIQP
jgi:hypothetical protein